MNVSSILSLAFQILLAYEGGLTELEAGQDVASPFIQVGSVGGKPLYAKAVLSTTKS